MTDRIEWKLKPLQVADLPGEIPLDSGKASWTLGRDADNDIVCSAPSVSGYHARLELRGDEVWIEDLGSRNGTHLGGEPVVRARLSKGDVFQLGRAGPQFALVGAGGLDETVFVPAGTGAARAGGGRRQVGPETVEIMRDAIGLSGGAKVDDLVSAERSRSGRRLAVVGLVLVVLVAAAVWWAVADSRRRDREQSDRVARVEKMVQEQAVELVGRLDDEFAEREERARTALEEQRRAIEATAAEMRRELESRERSGSASAAEIASLREALDRAQRRLDGLDPIKLERERLARVAAVERAVVLIEVTLGLKNSEGRPLYEAAGGGGLNFDGVGRRWTRESSGSGFVVDADGWIVTNAHVVHKKGRYADSYRSLELDAELQVVFSETDERIPATLHSWDVEDGNDLAVLRIEPFADMPNLGGIDLDLPVPDRGTDVFVLGFPLGTSALQPSDKVVASTFRGILSRPVGEDFLQVDAAVHPGNSGGPVIDRRGRVVGVVVGQQRIGELGASDIGYVIPIARLAKIWPPNG